MADTTMNLAAASLTFSVLSFLLLLVGLLMWKFPQMMTLSASLPVGTGFMGNISKVAAIFGAFSPDITLLSGFISDIINGSFRFSVTSFIGIFSVILHWIIAGLVYGFGKGAVSTASTASAVSTVAQAVTAPAQSIPAAAAAVVAAVAQPLGTGGPTSTFTATGEAGLTSPQNPRASALTGSKPDTTSRGPGSRIRFGLDPAKTGPRTTRKAAEQGEARRQMAQAGNPDAMSSISGSGRQSGGAISLSDINPCAIQGLGYFDISKSPMGMAALTSVFTVYLLDMYIGEKRSKLETGVYLLFSGVVYGLNIFAYKEFKCYGETYSAIAKASILPMVVGIAGGAAGYSVLQTTFPSYLPLDAQLIGSPNGANPPRASCGRPNDQDQFVCDAYKDGKRISTTIA